MIKLKTISLINILFVGVVLLTLTSEAQNNLCLKNNFENNKNTILDISHFVKKNPVITNSILQKNLKQNQVIQTNQNEFVKLIFDKPFKLEIDIYPNTTVAINKNADEKCGPQIKLKSGKIKSIGNHPSDLSVKNLKLVCEDELETEEVFVRPLGTTYIAETGALTEAIAELNGAGNGTDDVGGDSAVTGAGVTAGENSDASGEGGLVSLGTQEKFSVDKGSLQIKLKKISKIKTRNKIKYTKAPLGDKRKKSNYAKNKNSTKYLAYDEKIKLNAGSSLKVKRSRHAKKTQTAELEVLDPWSN